MKPLLLALLAASSVLTTGCKRNSGPAAMDSTGGLYQKSSGYPAGEVTIIRGCMADVVNSEGTGCMQIARRLPSGFYFSFEPQIGLCEKQDQMWICSDPDKEVEKN